MYRNSMHLLESASPRVQTGRILPQIDMFCTRRNSPPDKRVNLGGKPFEIQRSVELLSIDQNGRR